MLIDSHAHLLKEEFGEELEKELKKINKSNVKIVNNIGYNLKSSEEAVQLTVQYEFLLAAVGVHPYDIKDFKLNNAIENVYTLARNKRVVAIGEIGLDYFRDISDFGEQRQYFKDQILIAKELGLPIIVHSRDAFEDTFNIIKETSYFNGVFHSFDYGIEEAKKVLDSGMFISFSGMLTFKSKDKLREVAKIVPLDRVLFETDSPYLAPVPKRGKRNTPLYVEYVYRTFAEIRGIKLEELEKIAEKNFVRLFNRSKNFINGRHYVQDS